MSTFVLFSRLFGHFCKFDVFSKMAGGGGGANLTPNQSNSMFLVIFLKAQRLSNNFSKKSS